MLSWKFGNKRVSFFLLSLKEETRKGSYIRIGFFFRREKAFPKRKRESSKKIRRTKREERSWLGAAREEKKFEVKKQLREQLHRIFGDIIRASSSSLTS